MTSGAEVGQPSAPLITDGTVYFGTHEGNLHAVDAQTATEEWTVDLSSEQVNNLTMVDGSLYAPTFDDVLHALDPGNGDEQWRFEADGSVEPPAVGDGTLYFGSNADIVYALDIETGEEQWTFETGANAVMTPALVDGTVIATEYDPDIEIGRAHV